MTRIVVTGANGQLGSEFKYSNNQNIISLSRKDCDITNFEKMEHLINDLKPKYLINCAAYTKVDEAEENVEVANLVNKFAVENLSNLANKYNFTLIHISTDYIFDGDFSDPIKENAVAKPLNIYGQSKLDGENFVKKNTKKFFVLRVGWVYGPFGENFPKTIMRLLSKKKKLDIVNDQFGSPTPTWLIKDCILELIRTENKSYDVYNIAPNDVCSWFDVAKFVAKELGVRSSVISPIKSSQFKRKALRPNFTFLDNKAFSELTNFNFSSWKIYMSDFLNKRIPKNEA